MDPLFLGLAATCLVGTLHTTEREVDGHREERVRVSVTDTGACDELALSLPAGADLVRAKAVVVFADGPHATIDPRRWERLDRLPSGDGGARLVLPELHPGGTLKLDLTRAWTHPSEDLLAVPPPVLPAHVERVDTLVAPPGDVQRALYPGGGSWVFTQVTADFPPTAGGRWVLPLPLGASELELPPSTTPQPDALLVDIPPSEAPQTLTLGWRSEDAPVHGLIPAGPVPTDYDVIAREGTVRWEHEAGAWWLYELHGQPVLPGHKPLLAALDRRFGERSLPEPAIPFRVRSPGWDIIDDLLADLRTRVTIAPTPLDPLQPNRLVRARHNRLMTPLEAVLTLRAQLRQVHVDAHWLLVRPANTGVGGAVSPAGYTDALLAITFDGETRWVDPGCRSCATFELRPELAGASYLGYGRTPLPSTGSATLSCASGSDTCDVELTGAAALDLRRHVATLPAEHRSEGIAAAFDDSPSAPHQVVEISGLDVAGAPVHLRLSGIGSPGAPVRPTPLPTGGAWWPWRGLAQWVSDGPALEVERSAFSLRRADGLITLRIAEQAWTSEDWTAYDQALNPATEVPLP